MSRPTMEALTVSVSIERPLSEVYDFTSVPENFPTWASPTHRASLNTVHIVM